ncbi:PiggyBac transposable element-derived protein 4 [Cucumispora dikerogammari]|nr:PiggyBac transposable element-derived protein 4 [Cucumispora dikerogammari]
MKFYLLADSKTSYIMNIKLYTGKYSSIKDTVSDLLSNHTGKNHTLYMDNYYNSIALCEELRVKQIYCCGTMRMQRGEPKDYSKERKLMRKFDFKCAQKNGINILLWYDKKVVCFVSTFMNIEESLQKTKKVLLKPNMIKDYDQNMGGVDIFDQMLKSYYNERKSQKWTNKLTIYLINMRVHNSFILQKNFNKNPNRINHQITYRKEIIKYLSVNHDSEQKTISIKKEIKLQKRHWPCEVTNT